MVWLNAKGRQEPRAENNSSEVRVQHRDFKKERQEGRALGGQAQVSQMPPAPHTVLREAKSGDPWEFFARRRSFSLESGAQTRRENGSLPQGAPRR